MKSKPKEWRVWKVLGASWNLEFMGIVEARGDRSAVTAAKKRWGVARYRVQLVPQRNPDRRPRRYLSLKDIYEDQPGRDEGIWQHVEWDEYEGMLYRVVELDPRKVVKWLMPRGDTTIAQAFKDFATKEQKETVKYYREVGLKEATNGYLVVDLDSEELIDGHHRVIALAKKKVKKVRALDLGDEWSWEEGCVICGGSTDDYVCEECMRTIA